jgi:hypothetical protein
MRKERFLPFSMKSLFELGIINYTAQYSNSGTSYVYSASQVIDGQTYHGLFAYREYAQPTVFAITTNGICLVLRDDGSARLMWIHKTRGAAW